MLKLLRAACVALALVPASGFAATLGFDVHANNHVWNNGSGYGGNLGLDTGLDFNAGDVFSVNVADIYDTWNFCVGGSLASCEVNAAGERSDTTILGNYANSGSSFAYGMLVGRVGNGDFFEIGTSGFIGAADATGRLSLFHWDHNTNNDGLISVKVNTAVVPLPAGMTLLLSALGVFGLVRRVG